MSSTKIAFIGIYGDIFKHCLYAINSIPPHDRLPMQVYSIIDDCLNAYGRDMNRDEREKCRNAMISRVEPLIHYGNCDGCGIRLLATDDSFCSRTCETRHRDWR